MEEAYSKDKNIKPTARKHNVDPSNIRRWKKQLDKLKAQFPGKRAKPVKSSPQEKNNPQKENKERCRV